jgi:hypothetical protein
MNNAGVSFIECRENVGYWQAYPTLDYKQGLLNIHQFFMNEGPCGGCHNHYENIMSSNLQEVGVGVAIDDNHVWVTEDFIQPDASAPLVTSITASVSPGSYDCSQDHTKFNFSATIHLSSNPNGVTLTYVWLRSDGGTMSPITITVPAGQTSASISTYWFLFTEADNGTYWEQVAVSAPNSVTSNQATFSKAC